jgi:phospholipid/cholesterol/gamma-HCH transport system permease protein
VSTAAQALAAPVAALAASAGGPAVVLYRAGRALLSHAFERREVLRHMFRMGWQSLPVLSLSSLLIGGILVVQTGLYVTQLSLQALVGWGVEYGILREIGPLLTALVFSGRAGSRNAAEIATMSSREQLDGLRALGIDPYPAVIAPRVAAAIASLFLLTLVCDAVALAGGMGMAQALLDISPLRFWASATERGGIEDLVSSMVKSIAFGAVIAGISSHEGLRVPAGAGATAVGQAATRAVVRTIVAVVGLHLLLTPIV